MALSYPTRAAANRFGWLNDVWECGRERINASPVALDDMKCYKLSSN